MPDWNRWGLAVDSAVSRAVVAPISLWVAITLWLSAAFRPFSEFAGVGVTAIGLMAGLAAICLSTANPVGFKTTPQILTYAGERLLHATILLLQALLFAYARDMLINLVKSQTWLVETVRGVTTLLLGSVIASAGFCSWGAIASLNNELWSNWRRRQVEEAPAAPAKEPPPPSPPTD
jgi:hypothetical protein